MFSHDDNDFNNLQALVEAVKQWYIHSPGHDVGTDLNKVAVAYVRYEARAGFATAPDLCKGTNCTVRVGSTDPHSPECLAEYQATINYGGPTGQPDLPPIVPEMLASPNALAAAPEPDMETLDAMERAGRLALVEETRKSWLGREVTTGTEFTIAPATVDLQTGKPVSTSGYIAVLPDPVADDARQAYDNRYHKVRAEVSFDSWLKAYRHFVGLDVAAVKGSDIEAMAKSYSD